MENENKTLEKEKLSLERTFKRKIKILTKRLLKARTELDQCLDWEKTHHEALLLQSNLYRIKRGMKEIHLLDWNQNKEISINLDPLIEPYHQIEKKYKLAKKLKKGIPYRIAIVKKAEEVIDLLQKNLKLLESIVSLEDLASLKHSFSIGEKPKKSTESTAIAKKIPYKEFYSVSGMKIWVGKNAKANDELTFNYAHGSDWWLHVCDFPGSHVVIKVEKGKEPDQETLHDAMQLALEYSKAKEEAGICMTQCKYLRKFGKQSGKVHVSKHKVIHTVKDRERLKRLKDRLNQFF